MARSRDTRVAEQVVAIPRIENGVTQTDIEQYGLACYEAGRKRGRAQTRDEIKAARDEETASIREALQLAEALRDGGMETDQIEPTVVRIMTGRFRG